MRILYVTIKLFKPLNFENKTNIEVKFGALYGGFINQFMFLAFQVKRAKLCTVFLCVSTSTLYLNQSYFKKSVTCISVRHLTSTLK